MRSNYTDYKPRTINRKYADESMTSCGSDDKVWSALVTPLASRTEEWWVLVMEVGLDPELTKWSVRLGPAIVLTGKGYKEHHWLVVPSINHFGYLQSHTPLAYSTMPMSACTIPGTQDQFGRGRAAVRVHGQTGHCTNAGRAITPFMFNEEGYHVSCYESVVTHVLTLTVVCS